MKKNGINVTIVSIFDRRCKIMRYIAFLFIWIALWQFCKYLF